MIKTILVIEDSESDQFYNELIITSHNNVIKIIKAYDGEEALETIKEQRDNLPDLILLDINMPRMNGHEFLEEYAKTVDQEIPVVVMLTSSEQEADKQRAFEYNCVKDYLLKPISEEKLADLDLLVSNMQKES